MSVTWDNLGSQDEKKALSFFKSLQLSDAVIAKDGEKIKNHLLGCYENFSSSQLVQAKVFELLAVILSKSRRKVFAEDNLALALHYAKNMMSEWTSSAEVTINVLKFMTVLYEKEKPGAVDEELIAQCGEILKSHIDNPNVQKICLTFICSVMRHCNVESFSESSVSDLALPVVETIRSCKDDIDAIIKALVVLTFLFERVPEHLHAASMDALDAVSALLLRHHSNMAVVSMSVEFIQLCAVEDTHFIILSSTDQGFGLYCDLCLKFFENNDINSVLACAVLLKRACGDSVKEITVNSIPGLKKKFLSSIGAVHDTAAAKFIDATPKSGSEDTLQQIVLACDGILAALDASYKPSAPKVASSTSGPMMLPRSNSSPNYAPPKPPTGSISARSNSGPLAPHEEPVASVSLLAHANSAKGGKKTKHAHRRTRNTNVTSETDDSHGGGVDESDHTFSTTPSVTPRSTSTRSPGGKLDMGSADKGPPIRSFKDMLMSNSDDDISTLEESAVNSGPKPTYKASPDNVPRLNLSKPPPHKLSSSTAKSAATTTATIGTTAVVEASPRNDPLLDKIKSFQTVLSNSNSNTPRNGYLQHSMSMDSDRDVKSISQSTDELDKKDASMLQVLLDAAVATSAALQQRLSEESALRELASSELDVVVNEKLELQARLIEQQNSADLARESGENSHRASMQAIDAADAERVQLMADIGTLEATLERAVSEASAAQASAQTNIDRISLERDALIAEVDVLKQNTTHALHQDESTQATVDLAVSQAESLRNEKLELLAQLEDARSSLEKTEADAAARQEQQASEINDLTCENRDYAAQLEHLSTLLQESSDKISTLQGDIQQNTQLEEISKKSQEQAALAVHRVEELHSVLTEATAKIESLLKDNAQLQVDLDDALGREEALVLEQEELISAYRVLEKGEDEGNISVASVTIVTDDNEKIVVAMPAANGTSMDSCDTAMHASELFAVGDGGGDEDVHVEHSIEHDGRYQDDDDSYYHNNLSMQHSGQHSRGGYRKTPTESAAQGIRSALQFLHIPISVAGAEGGEEMAVLVEDLADLVQQYFHVIVKCPTSDPTKSINHTLRSNALCAALCVPQLGLVDNKKLMRSDVEIAIKRQKGKKHKLDVVDNDAPTLLFRLIEVLTDYVQKENENENIWIQSSINQQQSMDSPTRVRDKDPSTTATSATVNGAADDEPEGEEFTPEDLMSASRLLNKELKTIQSIFECYPSYANSDRGAKGANSKQANKGRSLDTVVLFAKDFGICPSLMDRTQCIHIIGQEIRRSQNDPNWVCQDGKILVSFSQFQIFLMNVALKNKNFGVSSGFITATQKLAGLLWWMDNSGGKDRLHEKDRNFKVCPFRVHGLIPTVKPIPRGEDFWLEK